METKPSGSSLSSQDQFAAPETIDLTPAGLKTPEGVARFNAAKDAWDGAAHAVANLLSEDVDEGLRVSDELRELLAVRASAQEEFLRAVAGVPMAGAPRGGS